MLSLLLLLEGLTMVDEGRWWTGEAGGVLAMVGGGTGQGRAQ